ncbi:LOW QUALITY PROTEIN: methyl-CpG-binding domain protein 1 [Columba livia]|uniref:LOW QUALITY PROTEIN: methyl-CpG-binding domain protein 1 n=1 Tax=Columba livia TaxID=8932 RepID=UPI0031BB5946
MAPANGTPPRAWGRGLKRRPRPPHLRPRPHNLRLPLCRMRLRPHQRRLRPPHLWLRPLPLRLRPQRNCPPTPEDPETPSPPEPPQEGVVACCGGCQGLFPGVTLPTQRRCRWLCPECRARRREFNREQRFYKRVGCGSCGACLLPRDCGICSACARPSPAKCLLRRCLRIVKKGWGCGSCGGCLSTEDCGSCCFCRRRLQPGRKRQWRCLRRRCLRPQRSGVTKKPPPGPRKLALKQTAKEKKKPGRPPKHPGTRGGGRSRRNRRCGACPGCERPADCGRCDFCRDKPKFGGRNRKRQKCRWRQCLRRAMVKEQPLGLDEKGPLPPPGPPLPLPPCKEEPGPLPHLEDPRLGLLIASAPRLKSSPPAPNVTPGPPPPGDLGVLIAATPRVKQEPPPSASLVPVPPRLPRLVVLDESEEEEEEGGQEPHPLPPPPIFPGTFLAELAEIPLPAHWGVVDAVPPIPAPPEAPRVAPPALRLVQRCPRSPMAATAVLLAPGLAFRVLVAPSRPVPPGHEVLASRPPRLRSVDDLVELLCDLESYRPCPGPPGDTPRPPAPRCHVLVPGGRCCQACLLLGGGEA